MTAAAHTDFTPLQEKIPMIEESEINQQQYAMYIACSIYYDLHLGSVMRYMRKTSTLSHIDMNKLFSFIKPLTSKELYDDLWNTFTKGAPAFINAEIPASNLQDYMNYGNHSTINHDPKACKKSILKELKNKWIFILPPWMIWFIPNAHLTPQGIIQKPDKPDRLVFDASFMLYYYSDYINKFTNKKNEPRIHFQYTWPLFLQQIWNLRISYPDEDILTLADDVTGAFRQCKYNPEILPGFLYILYGYLCVSMSQNFGTNFAPSQFESVARIREILHLHYQKDKTTIQHLLKKHKDKLAHLRYDNTPLDPKTIVKANPDPLNPGVLHLKASGELVPQYMFVDNALMAMLKHQVEAAAAASFESIYTILGEPDTKYRQDAVSIKKLDEMRVGHCELRLGYLVNTRGMYYLRDPSKIAVLHKNLNKYFHPQRKRCSLKEISIVTGKLVDFSNNIFWLKTLFLNIKSALYTCRKNTETELRKNPRFRNLFREAAYNGIDPNLVSKARFANSKIQKMIWNSKLPHNIPTNFRKDIYLLKQFLKPNNIQLKVPIAHVVKRINDFDAHSDASLEGCGGCSVGLLFWWYLPYPDKIKDKTIKRRFKIRAYSKDGTIISINLFEYVAIILNYAAALYQILYDPSIKLQQPYPTLKNLADNISSIKWAEHACHGNDAGKVLSRIFAALTYDSPLGLHPDFIKGDLNISADAISRFTNTKNIYSQFHKLLQTQPQLRSCKRLIVTDKFASLLWQALLEPLSLDIQLQSLKVNEIFAPDKDIS